MDLSEDQKMLIKQIMNTKVVDLYTYVTKFLKPKVFKYDIKEIEEKKRQNYEKAKDKIDDYLGRVKKTGVNHGISGVSFTQLEYTEDEIEEMRKKLSNFGVNYSDFEKNVKLKGEQHSVNTLKEEIYLLDDLYSAMLEFLSLWNILEGNQFVLTVPKQITKNDAKIFFQKVESKKVNPPMKNINKLISNKPSQIKLDDLQLNLPLPFDEKRFYKRDDKEYSDVRISINEDALVLAENHIDKKMLVLPGLKEYVENNFMTKAEKKYREERKRANIATIISLISVAVALASIGFTYLIAIDNTNFWEENELIELEQTEEMNSLLLDINERLLEMNQGLNEINSNENLTEKINNIDINLNKISKELENVRE